MEDRQPRALTSPFESIFTVLFVLIGLFIVLLGIGNIFWNLLAAFLLFILVGVPVIAGWILWGVSRRWRQSRNSLK